MTYTISYYNDSKNLVGTESVDCVTDSAAAEYASIQVYDYRYKRDYKFFVLRDGFGAIVASGNQNRANVKFY